MRKATWAILIWVALIVVWIVAGASSASGTPCDPALSQDLCDSATAIGTGLGVTFILIIGLLGFFVLAIIWFMSRPHYIEYDGQIMTEKEARKRSKTKEIDRNVSV